MQLPVVRSQQYLMKNFVDLSIKIRTALNLFGIFVLTRFRFDIKHLGEVFYWQAENEQAKEEVQDVLQALEELALNYDRKVQIAEDKSKELLQTNEELTEKSVSAYHKGKLSLKCSCSNTNLRVF